MVVTTWFPPDGFGNILGGRAGHRVTGTEIGLSKPA